VEAIWICCRLRKLFNSGGDNATKRDMFLGMSLFVWLVLVDF
jgi:hypothetical protein